MVCQLSFNLSTACEYFQTQPGIPFAEPPVGSLRFAPPKLKLNPGVAQLNATAFGPECIQFNLDPASYGIAEVSEDCLFVNIFRPAGVSKSARLPVLTWVYGGGFLCTSKFIFFDTTLVFLTYNESRGLVYV